MGKVLIITGGNKGIGQGICEAYKNNGYQVFSISRSQLLADSSQNVNYIQFDLQQTKDVTAVLEEILMGLPKREMDSITLINNAATTGPIRRFEETSSADIEKVISLNVVAPLMLTSGFIQYTKGWNCRRHIINISSGAAINPLAGISTYCVSKAAIDMLTKSIALEQAGNSGNFKIISVYPGLVDTDMQRDIRTSNSTHFPEVKTFREFKRNGDLAGKYDVGNEIYHIDHNVLVTNGSILDLDVYRYSTQKLHAVPSIT
ncbi:MAG TPA: SDR family NAD(P)-dependent oxidoreductase [Chitinophagaceae bacterium]|nr:SDR family NAD(P)-dependent oxidoreductase [Chitinophagaceae bacterium]HPH31312.1 SDR family NAD(P)-dependent oxidoreductase [Chitinophagaceae bacterium]HPN59026.1 SDR family NAD(P)-dependent oxidoreductase [Chitinophagaceae bacterium]